MQTQFRTTSPLPPQLRQGYREENEFPNVKIDGSDWQSGVAYWYGESVRYKGRIYIVALAHSLTTPVWSEPDSGEPWVCTGVYVVADEFSGIQGVKPRVIRKRVYLGQFVRREYYGSPVRLLDKLGRILHAYNRASELNAQAWKLLGRYFQDREIGARLKLEELDRRNYQNAKRVRRIMAGNPPFCPAQDRRALRRYILVKRLLWDESWVSLLFGPRIDEKG